MARTLNKLTPLDVKNAKPGTLDDGGGLRLQVTSTGVKTWIFRYQLAGKRREMGLGPLGSVSLADARRKAAEGRDLLTEGKDPIEVRDAARAAEIEAAAAAEAARKVAEAKRKTFKEFAEEFVTEQEKGFKNPKKLGTLWRGTLKKYVYPVIGELPVNAVDVALVMQVLKPLWATKNETAQRVRMRLENVLSAATVLGLREGPNPAIWRGNLDKLLPPARKVAKVVNRPSLPYADVPAFMEDLKGREAPAARALELTILTACRTVEVLAAEWAEIDLDAKVWVIPASRMKMDIEHRVPLSTRAVDILRGLQGDQQGRPSPFVFPGGRAGKPLSNMAMLVLLKDRMKRTGITIHGFRSSFRNWCAEQTGYPHEVCEMALAHQVGDETTRAYLRTDLFDKRVQLMEDWATYCQSKPAS